jgi:hypothetical protein
MGASRRASLSTSQRSSDGLHDLFLILLIASCSSLPALWLHLVVRRPISASLLEPACFWGMTIWCAVWTAVCLIQASRKRRSGGSYARSFIISTPALWGAVEALAHLNDLKGIPAAHGALFLYGMSVWGPIAIGSIFSAGMLLMNWAISRAVRKRDARSCACCGYLLYHADQGRCPECGQPFSFKDR